MVVVFLFGKYSLESSRSKSLILLDGQHTISTSPLKPQRCKLCERYFFNDSLAIKQSVTNLQTPFESVFLHLDPSEINGKKHFCKF